MARVFLALKLLGMLPGPSSDAFDARYTADLMTPPSPLGPPQVARKSRSRRSPRRPTTTRRSPRPRRRRSRSRRPRGVEMASSSLAAGRCGRLHAM